MPEPVRPVTNAGASRADAPVRCISPWRTAAVKAGRVTLCVTLLAAVPQLVGCMSSFGLQSDGSYRLETTEASATCDALYKSIWGRIELIRALPAKAMAEQASPPPTASSLLGRWFGGSSRGLKTVEEYDRERAHAYALLRTMREKKCVTVDLDREIAEATELMARIRQD